MSESLPSGGPPTFEASARAHPMTPAVLPRAALAGESAT